MLQELNKLINGEEYSTDAEVGRAEAAIRCAEAAKKKALGTAAKKKAQQALVAGRCALQEAQQALRSERGHGDVPPPRSFSNTLEDQDSLDTSICSPPRTVAALEYQTVGKHSLTQSLTHITSNSLTNSPTHSVLLSYCACVSGSFDTRNDCLRSHMLDGQELDDVQHERMVIAAVSQHPQHSLPSVTALTALTALTHSTHS